MKETTETKRNVFHSIEGHIQRRTMAGMLQLLPLLVTVIVLAWIIDFADGLVRRLPFVQGQPWDFPTVGLIVGIVLFYLVGLVIANAAGRRGMEFMQVMFEHVPIVRVIFGVTKQAMASLSSQYRFTRVVFVEWPREGMIALGFVTGKAYSQPKMDPVTKRMVRDSIVVVYVPTVPNPTSGNMALVLEDNIIETDMTVEDAMKLVFSGGIVLPDAVSFGRMPVERDDFQFVGRFETTDSSAEDEQL